MMSRRRLFPWFQTSWRRGGVSSTPYMLLVVIFITSVITLFIRTNGNQTFEVFEGHNVQNSNNNNNNNNNNNVKFVAPDPSILAQNEDRKKKAILKQAPYNDSIAEVFNEKAIEVKKVADQQDEKNTEKESVDKIIPEHQKVKPITKSMDYDENEDFAEVAGEEFVPPNDLLKVMKNFVPLMQSSLVDVAKKVAPVLAQTMNDDGQGNLAINLIGNALPLLLGSDTKGSSSSSNGLENAMTIAKLFLNGKSGLGGQKVKDEKLNNDKDKIHYSPGNKQSQENSENIVTMKVKNFREPNHNILSNNNLNSVTSKTQIPNWKEDARENSRMPLSVADLSTDSKIHRESKKGWGTFFTSKKLTDMRRITKRTSRTPKWILDSLSEKNREKSTKDIKNIYNLLMKNSNLLHKRDSCERIVPYSKNTPDWKEDDFQGTQFICEDLDFEVYFQRNCIIYSFGIGNDWSFEEAMAEKGCEVWAFDFNAEKPVSLSSKIHFFNDIFLGSKNEEQTIKGKHVKYYTLETINTKLKHSKRNITYLKLNINGEEWPILEQIINETPLVLNNVLQIGIKTHLHTAMMDHTLYGQYFNLLRQLPALGYQLFTAAKVQDNLDDVYQEPLLNNKEVSLTNYAAYFRL